MHQVPNQSTVPGARHLKPKRNHKLVGKRHLIFFARGTLAIRLKNLIVVRGNEVVVELGIYPRLLVH